MTARMMKTKSLRIPQKRVDDWMELEPGSGASACGGRGLRVRVLGVEREAGSSSESDDAVDRPGVQRARVQDGQRRAGASALPFPFSSCFVFHRARRFCDGVEGRRRPRRWGGDGDGGEAPASAWSARARGGAGASAGDGGEAPARGTAALRRGCAGVR